MQTEFEAKFLDIDVPTLRARLSELGATLTHPERLMRRAVFHPPVAMPGAWARVRDEGDRITMSLKQVTGERIEDQREAELVIDDFDRGREFLRSLGAREKAYQETRRESYSLDGVSVDIDTWPGLAPYVEIEAESESIVREISRRL
jgi:adenylate cyclase, class 2